MHLILLTRPAQCQHVLAVVGGGVLVERIQIPDEHRLLRVQVEIGLAEHEALGKTDFNLNAKQTMFIRYLYAFYENPATYDGQNVLTLSRTGQENQVHSIVYGHNYIMSPTTLNSRSEE